VSLKIRKKFLKTLDKLIYHLYNVDRFKEKKGGSGMVKQEEIEVEDNKVDLIEVLDWLCELDEQGKERYGMIIKLTDGRCIGIYRAEWPETLSEEIQ